MATVRPHISSLRLLRSRKAAAALFTVALGAAAFAGTCQFQKTRLTTIGSTDTYAGEVVNNSGVDFLGTAVDVAFLDASGNVVETDQVEPALRSFQDGATNFFSVAAAAPPSDTSSAIARLATDSTLVRGTTVAGYVSLSNVAAQRDVGGTTLRVTGTITNYDSVVLADPHVVAVVRDDSGNVVVVGSETGISDLAEGQSATFSVEVGVPDSTATVSSVDIWADGLEDGVPVNPVSFTAVAAAVVTATATPTDTATPTATATSTPTPIP